MSVSPFGYENADRFTATSKEAHCRRSCHFHASDRRRKPTTHTDSVDTNNSHGSGFVLSTRGRCAKSSRDDARCNIGCSHGSACATATRHQFNRTIPEPGRKCKRGDPSGSWPVDFEADTTNRVIITLGLSVIISMVTSCWKTSISTLSCRAPTRAVFSLTRSGCQAKVSKPQRAINNSS